jgi:hypothetical protein
MNRMRSKRVLVAGAVVLVIAIGLALAIALRGGGEERSSPEVLNKPTDARRIMPLRPGPNPNFAPPEIEEEKHGEND